jgi:squalene-hopene/tetraprenyl-beta-curcumene cyclase
MSEFQTALKKNRLFSRFFDLSLNQAIDAAQNALIRLQDDSGYWSFESESDCLMSADYILLTHFIGDIDELLQRRLVNYMRKRQAKDGSFALFPGGLGDVSLTTKVYLALKLSGDSASALHMENARNFILNQGGGAACNVYTRFSLAEFEQIPWRAIPYTPVEIILLPKWSPFHIYRVSYWVRILMVPLSILYSCKATAKNPKKIGISELFIRPPELEKNYFARPDSLLGKIYLGLGGLGRALDCLIPNKIRQFAVSKAFQWIQDRLNGEDGLGAMLPAMLFSYKVMSVLGISEQSSEIKMVKKAIKKLLITKHDEAYFQPCFSPTWDTGFSTLALQECGTAPAQAAIDKSLNWLLSKQIGDAPGDWRNRRPHFKGGGGWAFEFNNSYYPDVDDTAVVAFALCQSNDRQFDVAIDRAVRWVEVMQSKNGGFAAFDADNTDYSLNDLPFLDNLPTLDTPSADVSARSAMLLASVADQQPRYQTALDTCIDFLWKEQELDGSWFGRWGTNYIYGTWSVLIAMEQAKIPNDNIRIQRAVRWLKSVQRSDGGWGEDNQSYHDDQYRGKNHISTICQTSWALLGLMAAGEDRSAEVVAGIRFLMGSQEEHGLWQDVCFNAPIFPGTYYLRYYGYDKYFPLWALARYQKLR